KLGHGAVIPHVTRVQRGFWLEQQDVYFFGSHGQMLHSLRNDDEFAGIQFDRSVAQVDGQSALDDKEELIFVLMLVPDELALKLHQLNLRVVYLAGDFRAPMVVEEPEFLAEIDFLDHTKKI